MSRYWSKIAQRSCLRFFISAALREGGSVSQFVVLLAFVVLSSVTHAAQYCVTNAAFGLVDSLALASASTEDDEIRFVKGALNLSVDLEPPSKIYGDLALRGGYDSGCTTRLDNSAMTQITASGRTIRLFPRQQSDITIERLDFVALKSISVVDNIAEFPGAYGLIFISRSGFRNVEAGLAISVFRHNVRISNSLFANNYFSSISRGLSIESYHNIGTAQDATVNVSNCTIVGFAVGIWVLPGSMSANSPLPRVSNIISRNNAIDVLLSRPTDVRYSVYKTVDFTDSGALGGNSVANLMPEPVLALDAFYRPKPGSNAINSGDNSVVPSHYLVRDYYGKSRIVQGTVDRGAVETASVYFGN
jgi:hypothetical protein